MEELIFIDYAKDAAGEVVEVSEEDPKVTRISSLKLLFFQVTHSFLFRKKFTSFLSELNLYRVHYLHYTRETLVLPLPLNPQLDN